MHVESNHSLPWIKETIAGIRVEPFDLQEPFIDLAARFAHLPGTVALLSGGDLDCARYHLLGIWPWMTISGRSRRIRLTVEDRRVILDHDLLAFLQYATETLRLPDGDYPRPMAAGLMGYLSYDLKDALEDLPITSVDDLLLPQMLFYAHALTVVHDKLTGATRLAIPVHGDAGAEADQILREFCEAAATPRRDKTTFAMPATKMKPNFTQDAYQAAVQRIIDYIRAGDVYQVNLSQRFQVPFEGSGFALFERLYALNPAPFFAFIQAGDHQIVSTSPERFLLRTGPRVETRPIKGTRPRGETAEQDEAMRSQLAASAKDDAELSMIVDLLRNDLGKVCRAGSVHVAEHKRLEAYQNVYHLVSTVAGELEEDKNSVDLVRAAFPGGSITGCPKVRAMEIIDELEPCRRHVYCGSIGYISFHDTMDLSIAIRTATIVNDTLCFSVGGGIVFDSDPQAEYEETLHKGRTLMAACRSGEEKEPSDPMVWCNGRLLPAAAAAVNIDDQGLQYGYGFFETVRVDNGGVPLLVDHLSRFTHSWRALMPGMPPDLTWHSIIDQVVTANRLQTGCAAVKILATRGSRTRAPWDYTLLVAARPYAHRLAGKKSLGLRLGTYPEPRQSPLADHKTLNYLYYLLAGQWALSNDYDEALILNPDGTVSETNTANLLIVNGSKVVRPASPAVLPGVMAGAFCRKLETWGFEIVQHPVRPEVLLSAEQVLAANALMGAVPVIQIDGVTRSVGGDLWRRLNDAVIPGWGVGVFE